MDSDLDIAKFGGTSVGNFAAMTSSYKVAISNPHTRLVVISACSGVTNILVELASGTCSSDKIEENLKKLRSIHQEIIDGMGGNPELTAAIEQHLAEIKALTEEANMGCSDELTDRLVSHGELMSSLLFTALFGHYGTDAVWFDVREVMRTDSNFGCATPLTEVIASLAKQKLLPLLKGDAIVITQGFIGSNSCGQTTTLGRGGSDYSGALLGEALDAATISIWTDVPGVYTSDPRVVSGARPIAELTYMEAAEMANFGAKVLHPATIAPAVRKHIPVFVGSSREPEKGGTWVRHSVKSRPPFRAAAVRKNQTLIILSSPRMVGAFGFLARVFAVFAKYRRPVDLVSTSEVSIAVTMDAGTNTSGKATLPEGLLEDLRNFCSVKVEQDLALVAIIGNDLSATPGVTTRAFDALEEYSVKMICYGASNHNLCFLVNSDEAEGALIKIHQHLLEPEKAGTESAKTDGAVPAGVMTA